MRRSRAGLAWTSRKMAPPLSAVHRVKVVDLTVRLVAEFKIALNAAPLPEPWEILVNVQDSRVTNAVPEIEMTEWVTGTGEMSGEEGETVTDLNCRVPADAVMRVEWSGEELIKKATNLKTSETDAEVMVKMDDSGTVLTVF